MMVEVTGKSCLAARFYGMFQPSSMTDIRCCELEFPMVEHSGYYVRIIVDEDNDSEPVVTTVESIGMWNDVFHL